MSSTGRKKARVKEKLASAGRTDRRRSSATQIRRQSATTVTVDDYVTASSDAPYVCSGRFGLDFYQLCHRAHLEYVPNVVARPHRPPVGSGADEKRTTTNTKTMWRSLFSQ